MVEMMREGSALQARVDEHSHRWRKRSDEYWLMRLMQEVGELASVLAGDHDHTLEHELGQVASIAVNWLDLCKDRGKSEECRLPIPCPICKQHGLLFWPRKGGMACEQCDADLGAIHARLLEGGD